MFSAVLYFTVSCMFHIRHVTYFPRDNAVQSNSEITSLFVHRSLWWFI